VQPTGRIATDSSRKEELAIPPSCSAGEAACG